MISNPANKLQLVVLLITWADGTIIPDVQIALPGDNPVFRCFNNGQPSENFQIQYRSVGSSDPVILYSASSDGLNPKFVERYKISENSESYELTVLNVSSNQAGTYFCDWGDRSREAELVLLETSGPTCDSTVLKNENCASEVRFDCKIGFHGNVLPTLEFWMATECGTFGPVTTPAERKYNTSKTTLIQNISSDSSDSRYTCQLRNVNREKLNLRTNCNFERNVQSCKKVESTESSVLASVVIAVVSLAVILIITSLLINNYRLRKQLKKLMIRPSLETDIQISRTRKSSRLPLISKTKPESTRDRAASDAPVMEQ